MDFFDFASNTNIKVLSFLKAHPNSNFNDILARSFYQMSDLQNELIFLQKQNLIQTNPHLNPEFDEWAKTPVITVSLSSKGIAYLNQRKRNLFRTWVPIVISFLALFTSIVGLVYPKCPCSSDTSEITEQIS